MVDFYTTLSEGKKIRVIIICKITDNVTLPQMPCFINSEVILHTAVLYIVVHLLKRTSKTIYVLGIRNDVQGYVLLII